MLRPSVLLRRKAMYDGFLGKSGFWKIVGVVLFGKSSIKKFFGKSPEVIDVSRLGAGRYLELTTAKPTTRRTRKKMQRQGLVPPTLDAERKAASLWASRARRAS
jgi:hypothetical protein